MVILSRVADDTGSGVQNSLELVGEGLGCTGENPEIPESFPKLSALE